MGNYLDVFSLKGKVSLVTGAGRGLGLGIATALAGAGSDLMVVSRTESQLTEAAQSLSRESGRRVEMLVADLTDADLPGVVQETVARLGRLDILINNAGSNLRKPFLEITDADFEAVIQIQLKSAYFMAQAAAREMVRAGRGGKIVNLASLTSKIGIPNISPYGAAKGGIFSLTKSLALELAPHNINVNAVAPGYVRTFMAEKAFADKKTYDWMLSRIPMRRFGTAIEIGNAALFLASSASDYITGEVLYVDGGWMAA